MTERDNDYYDEDIPRSRRAVYSCGDRTCGACDCPSCYPGSWRTAHVEEEEEEEKEPDAES
jgi:hypothetical protein